MGENGGGWVDRGERFKGGEMEKLECTGSGDRELGEMVKTGRRRHGDGEDGEMDRECRRIGGIGGGKVGREGTREGRRLEMGGGWRWGRLEGGGGPDHFFIIDNLLDGDPQDVRRLESFIFYT